MNFKIALFSTIVLAQGSQAFVPAPAFAKASHFALADDEIDFDGAFLLLIEAWQKNV